MVSSAAGYVLREKKVPGSNLLFTGIMLVPPGQKSGTYHQLILDTFSGRQDGIKRIDKEEEIKGEWELLEDALKMKAVNLQKMPTFCLDKLNRREDCTLKEVSEWLQKKEFQEGKGVKTDSGSNGSGSTRECEKIGVDMAEGIKSQGNLTKMLENANVRLDEEIKELEEDLARKKELEREEHQKAFNNVSIEIELDNAIRANVKKISDNKENLKEIEEKKKNKITATKIDASAKKIRALKDDFEKVKNDVEEKMAILKNKRLYEQKFLEKLFKYETLRNLDRSLFSFSVYEMTKNSIFEGQPKEFKSEWDQLENIKRIDIEKDDIDNVAEVLIEIKDKNNQEVGVLILDIVIDNFEMDDEDEFEVDVDTYADSLQMVAEKMKSKFGKVMIVIPSATKESFKVAEAISSKTESKIKGVKICNLLRLQKELGDKVKDGEKTWTEKDSVLWKGLCDKENGMSSNFARRYIISEMEKLGGSRTSKKICEKCALIHFSENCPPEMNAERNKKEKEIKSKQNMADELNTVSKGGDQTEPKSQKSSEQVRSRSRSPLVRGRESKSPEKIVRGRRSRSRSPASSNRREVSSKQKKTSRSRSPEKEERTSRSRSPEKKEKTRSRSPEKEERTSRSRSPEKKEKTSKSRSPEKKSKKETTRSPSRPRTELTEECMKCLRNHPTKDCRMNPHSKCNVCDLVGHQGTLHKAKKAKSVLWLKEFFGPEFKFI